MGEGSAIVTELSTLASFSGEVDEPFNPELCIICQISTNEKVVSSENGRRKVLDAAVIRKDEVFDRLQKTDSPFCYHVTNECYKRYTLKKSLQTIRDKADSTADDTIEEEDEPLHKKTRSSTTPREEPTSKQRLGRIKCIVCGSAQHDNITEKFRISESQRAYYFLEAVIYNQDEVYTRVSDLEDDSRIFGADIYYHKKCLERYLLSFSRLKSESKGKKVSVKRAAFEKKAEWLSELFSQGRGITLSEIRDMINDNSDCFITNKEVKLYLAGYFGDKVQYCPSNHKNEPLLVFSSSVSIHDVVKKIRSIDIMKEAGKSIRNVLKDIEFSLQDKFCDAEELKISWENATIPDELATFFSSLFNISRGKLMHKFDIDSVDECLDVDTGDNYSDDSDDLLCDNTKCDTLSDTKMAKVKSLYQVLYYLVHNGKKRLHFM